MEIRERYLRFLNRATLKMRRIPVARRRAVVAVSVLILLTVILSIEISPFGSLVEAGEPSPRTIRAPKTVQYLDKAKTREVRDAAARAVEDVYLSDDKASARALQHLSDFFQAVEEAAATGDAAALADKAAELSEVELTETDLLALTALDASRRERLAESARGIVGTVMSEPVSSGDLAEARDRARSSALATEGDEESRRLLSEVAATFLLANRVIDRDETKRLEEAARESVDEVITTRLQGEIVVSEGEVVSSEQVDLLKTLGFARSTLNARNVLYVVVILFLLFALVSMYLARYQRVYYDSPGLLALMGSMLVVYTIAAKVLTVAARSWSPFWGYLMPAAAVTIIAAVLFNAGIAMMLAMVCAVLTGMVTNGDFSLTSFVLISAMFPALFVSRFSTRRELRRAAMYTSLWVAMTAFGATTLTQLNQGLLVNTMVGFLNGLACAVIALGSLPFLETTFRITTNTQLLELASPEQKLLKELSAKAPGTYSHSVMVANLAEAAAREVGSDPMLARVTAYYHDVGKMLRPQFFVENQPKDMSLHQNISPNLSTLIITSHVRDGVAMLEEKHLPPDLVDIVREHHGTSVVRYFYDRAVEDAAGEPVEESRFRYHFEKPRRRTAGILMLADSVEAAARVTRNHSAAALEQTVERIVDGKLEDGQLDECELTFSDIVKIKEAFTRTLIATYHPRIDYPGTHTKAGVSNARKSGRTRRSRRARGATA
jgi:hypothetical protein